MSRADLLRAAELASRRQPFVLATVVWRRGPTSGRQGGSAVIRPDGSIEGWLGGACAEPTVVAEALSALADGRPRILVLGEHDHREGVTSVAMACESEGAMEVFLQPVLPAPRVVVVGRSPTVETLVRLARELGWEATVLDRPELSGVTVDRGTFVVVATQGHYDEPALEAALTTPARYVGLVASAKRAASVVEYLRARGWEEEDLSRIQAPAGLDLGSLEPEEMAVSIVAELVARKAAGPPLAEVAMPQLAVDPVCGMTVDPATARFMSQHGGVMYYFCAAGCLRAFEADPANFAGA